MKQHKMRMKSGRTPESMLRYMETEKYKQTRSRYLKRNSVKVSKYNSDYLKGRRLQAMRDGVCQKCLKRPVDSGNFPSVRPRLTCDLCAKKQSKFFKRWYLNKEEKRR